MCSQSEGDVCDLGAVVLVSPAPEFHAGAPVHGRPPLASLLPPVPEEGLLR